MNKIFKRKRVANAVLAALFVVSSIGGYSPVSKAAEPEAETVQVEYQKEDKQVIPDKFNTGAKGMLKKFVPTGTNDGVDELVGSQGGSERILELKKSSAEGTYNITFGRPNNQILSGRIEFNDMDLSDYTFQVTDFDKAKDITLVFNNCKFKILKNQPRESNVKFELNNSSIQYFSGSNAKFKNCAFGGSYEDGLKPFINVEVVDSYFSDFNYFFEGTEKRKETHIDCLQISGYEYSDKQGVKHTVDTKNLKFKNCRCELPNILLDGNKATINACLMLQVEFSNAYDISFEDCIVNGGADTIFARTTSDKVLQNISFKNIKIGDAKFHSAFYTVTDPRVEFSNVSTTDSLYIGSVFKEEGKTFFSVSNDTKKERKLRIITGNKVYDDITIPACPGRKELENKEIQKFSDMPLDILKSIDEDCDYAVCLDVTDENNIKQIRFVNYTDNPVCIEKSHFGTTDKAVLLEGSCGAKGSDVNFSLSNDYVLTISGTGAIANYDSSKLPPWNDYKGYIKKVVIEKGVTSIGNQAFNGCYTLETVVLPDGLKSICHLSFSSCTLLTNINIPESVESIAQTAFTNVAKKIIEDDSKDSEEDKKDPDSKESDKKDSEKSDDKTSDNKTTEDKTTESSNKDNKTREKQNSDSSNKSTTWKVGQKITDKKTGFVYKVKSVKKTHELALIKVPKKSAKVTVKTTVKISGKKCKVTSIGVNAFKGNKKVKQITLEKGISKISKGAFKGCKNLKKLVVKNKNLTKKYLKKIGVNKKVKISYK